MCKTVFLLLVAAMCAAGLRSQTPLPTFRADPNWSSLRTEMMLVIESTPSPGAPISVPLTGTMVVHLAAPRTSAVGVRVVDAEVMALDLSGTTAATGAVRLRLHTRHTSGGQVVAQSASSDFPADATLKIFFEVEIPNLGHTFAGGNPLTSQNAAAFSAQNLQRLPWLFRDFHPDAFVLPANYLVADFGTSYRLSLGTVMRAIQDPTFSVETTGLSALPHGDILRFGNPPPTCIQAANLGMFVPQDDMDALSYGYDFISPPEIATLIFSVDRFANGALNTDVDYEASKMPPQACGDEFVTTPRFPDGTNRVMVDQNQVHLQVAYQAIIDDMDALDDHPCSFVDPNQDGIPDRDVFYSVDINSFSMNEPNFRPGVYDPFVTDDDILVYSVANGMRGIYASGFYDIGLLNGDGIDALCLQRLSTAQSSTLVPGMAPIPGFPLPPISDYAIFSLTPNSPTLAGQNPLLPGGGSPGDIFLTNFSGTFIRYCTAASIGLLPSDNLDALKCPNEVTTWKVEGTPNLFLAALDFTYAIALPLPLPPIVASWILPPGQGPRGAADGLAAAVNGNPNLSFLGIKASVHEATNGAYLIFEGIGSEYFTLTTTSTELRLSRVTGNVTPTCEYSPYSVSRTDFFAATGPSDLLRVNGSEGGLGRRVSVPLNQPIAIEMMQSLGSAAPAPYIIFGHFGVPKPEDEWAPPIDAGSGMSFAPFYVDPTNPRLFVLADSFDPANPTAFVPGAQPTPHVIATQPLGLPFPLELTLQGVILDPNYGSPYLSFTNGVVVAVEDPFFYETPSGAIASSGLDDSHTGLVFNIDTNVYANDLETQGTVSVATQAFFNVVGAGLGSGAGNGAAPDVVAKFTATTGGLYTFDLCNSNFDTRIWLMPVTATLPTPGLIINDDADPACGPFFPSRLENICLAPGQTVLIVIDGFVANAGNASLVITKASAACATSGPITPLSDDGAVPYLMQSGSFKFYGTNHASVMVCMNGRIQFGTSGNSDWTESTSELRTQAPSINLFWDDLDPRPTTSPLGSVTFAETPTTLVITYSNITRYVPIDGQCSGSITLDKLSGAITFSYGAVNPKGCIVGISPGNFAYAATPPEVNFGSTAFALATGPLTPIYEFFTGPAGDPMDLSFQTIGFTPQGGVGIGPYLFHNP